jgi:hypothetical protein
MKKECGSNLWWLDDAKLHIRRQRKAVDILKGVFALAASAGLAWLLTRMVDLQAAFYMLFGVGYGLYSALGAWEVTLHRASRQASWRWGLGIPFFSRQTQVTDTDHVQLVTPKAQGSDDSRINKYSVHLASRTLAGTDNPEEAFALAEAVARHLRLGLQVDDGRVRPFEELASPERARALSSPALAELKPVEPSHPPGCRIQVREQGEQRIVELPAPGWVDAYRLQAGVSAVLMLLPLGAVGYLYSLHASWSVMGMMTPILLIVAGLGGFILHATRTGLHASWCISVSRRGLEVASTRPGNTLPPTRWAAGLIRDIDVREQTGDSMLVGVSGRPSCPMIVIQREDGTLISIGEGLSRAELEWAALRIRQELGVLTEYKSQELEAG